MMEKEEQSGKRWIMCHLLEESLHTGKLESRGKDHLRIRKTIGIEKKDIKVGKSK